MRTLLFFLVLCILSIDSEKPSAQTTFWFESQNKIDRLVTPQIDGLFFSTVQKPFGTYGWFQVSEKYSQAYYGPTFAPALFAQIGIALGIEQGFSSPRFGSFLWMGHGRYYLIALFEEAGGTGRWYKVEGNINLNRIFGVGFFRQAFFGSGVRVEANVPRTPVKIWGVLTQHRALLSMRLSF